jgi:hypothetical protein
MSARRSTKQSPRSMSRSGSAGDDLTGRPRWVVLPSPSRAYLVMALHLLLPPSGRATYPIFARVDLGQSAADRPGSEAPPFASPAIGLIMPCAGSAVAISPPHPSGVACYAGCAFTGASMLLLRRPLPATAPLGFGCEGCWWFQRDGGNSDSPRFGALGSLRPLGAA